MFRLGLFDKEFGLLSFFYLEPSCLYEKQFPDSLSSLFPVFLFFVLVFLLKDSDWQEKIIIHK